MSRHYKHLRTERDGEVRYACKPADHWGVWERDALTDETQVTCPGCLGIIHRKQLAERTEGPKLALVKVDLGYTYRFAYAAMVDGNHVGYVVYDGAYGRASWRIVVHNIATKSSPSVYGYQLDRDPTNERSAVLSFKTKEAALMACPDLVAEGRLKTLEQLKAEDAAWRKEWAAREARMAARNAAEAEEGDLALATLDELLQDQRLTNLQHAAIITARKALAKQVAQVKGSMEREKERAA